MAARPDLGTGFGLGVGLDSVHVWRPDLTVEHCWGWGPGVPAVLTSYSLLLRIPLLYSPFLLAVLVNPLTVMSSLRRA